MQGLCCFYLTAFNTVPTTGLFYIISLRIHTVLAFLRQSRLLSNMQVRIVKLNYFVSLCLQPYRWADLCYQGLLNIGHAHSCEIIGF